MTKYVAAKVGQYDCCYCSKDLTAVAGIVNSTPSQSLELVFIGHCQISCVGSGVCKVLIITSHFWVMCRSYILYVLRGA